MRRCLACGHEEHQSTGVCGGDFKDWHCACRLTVLGAEPEPAEVHAYIITERAVLLDDHARREVDGVIARLWSEGLRPTCPFCLADTPSERSAHASLCVYARVRGWLA